MAHSSVFQLNFVELTEFVKCVFKNAIQTYYLLSTRQKC